MWNKIATFILKKRIYFIVGIALFTLIMGYYGSKVQLEYNMQKIVPKDDPDFVIYEKFKKTFGEDGNKLVASLATPNLFELNFYNDFQLLCDSLSAQYGVNSVLSPVRLYRFELDTADLLRLKRFAPTKVPSQYVLDSLRQEFEQMKFYEGLLYNPDTKVSLVLISLNDSILNSKDRTPLIRHLEEMLVQFGIKHNIEPHLSGLPFVRYKNATTVRDEIVLFTLIAFAVTALLILLLFRSISTLLISLVFIAIGVITMMGVSGILGFKLNLLTGTLPPLLVVVGVQNTIYLINQYHDEYRKHKKKAQALTRIISRIGVATFLINFTTAVGFGTFYFTKTQILEQFGLVAFITINIIFVISIVGIPALYSYLPTPTDKQIAHLDNKNVLRFLAWVKNTTFKSKRRIYFWFILVSALSTVFIFRLKPLAFMVDDIPHDSKIYKDLVFLQDNFKGVMPYEILITTYEEGGVTSPEMLNKGRTLQKALKQFSELSKPMSLVEVVSAANQANNGNDPRFYRIPKATDLGELALKLPPAEPGKPNLLKGFVDTSFSQMRISYQMKDVGSIRMDSINKEVTRILADIFPGDQYNVKITGTTAIFLKGNSYLFDSLLSATFWSLLLISLTMGFLFPSIRMIIIAIVPNIIPLMITAGTMGYFNIPLKPSTILVFSIAFGITVDATIHFVSTFRREVIKHNKPIRIALADTIDEVGLSMIYTMLAICSGFLIFTFSEFQGTAALGWLTGLTIITGMAANLFLLPALILTFEKFINPKIELKEVVMEIPDED